MIPKTALDTILKIAETHDVANHVTGIDQYPGSKQIASNTIAQAKCKQELVPTETSNFGHTQNP
jgi:hypothetical protein